MRIKLVGKNKEIKYEINDMKWVYDKIEIISLTNSLFQQKVNSSYLAKLTWASRSGVGRPHARGN